VTVPHITDQLEGHNFNRYMDSLMRALEKFQTLMTTPVICVHISVYVKFVW